MYTSDSILDNARSGPLPIDLIHDRQTEHYFKNLEHETSNESNLCDEVNDDEDDCFTFDSQFAPIG